MVKLRLPYPPSVNHYWRNFRGQMRISAEGRAYRETVFAEILSAGAPKVTGRLAVFVQVYQPDAKARDLDNLPKALFDAMTKAGVWEDDSQIDDLRITRCGCRSPGFVDVTIRPMTGAA